MFISSTNVAIDISSTLVTQYLWKSLSISINDLFMLKENGLKIKYYVENWLFLHILLLYNKFNNQPLLFVHAFVVQISTGVQYVYSILLIPSYSKNFTFDT